MKKKIFIFAALLGLGMTVTSCSDMLDTDSDRQIFDPSLDQKTDSMFYTLGILRGMQQVADQYVLVNEMRGDLTATNTYTSTDLRQLANFSATASNKYDSAYVYYNIINNCNYYIAHRDTSLLTGSRKVAIPEYVQAKVVRAWAYLQLGRIYGTVPFYTNQLTNISDANNVSEKKNLQEICAAMAADLQPWAGTAVPTYGDIDAGQMNNGTSKTVTSNRIMLPVDLVLGDLYLESGNYQQAALSYFRYINAHPTTSSALVVGSYLYPNFKDMPNNAQYNNNGNTWFTTAFNDRNSAELITYIPMATNRLRGTVTNLPELFGYDYYSTEASSAYSTTMYMVDNQIDPSATYENLCSSQDYYYATTRTNGTRVYLASTMGDLRRYATFNTSKKDDSTLCVMKKYNAGNIFLYRRGVVFLRLAEAMNRMGYPDAAFAVLKDGMCEAMLQDTINISDSTRQMLQTTLPFLSEANVANYPSPYGIHSRGCGFTAGMQQNLYSYKSQVWAQVNATRASLGLETVEVNDSTPLPSKEEQIDAVEDLICNELAMEAAFEGSRFTDLCRMARHKNEGSPWGANYGSQWLAAKLAYKRPVVDLTDPNNWYLPFK